MAGGVVNQPAFLDLPRPQRQTRSTGGADVLVVDGGTGVSTLTDGGILLGSGTGPITAMAVLAAGAIVVGDGSGDPVPLAAFTSSTGTLKHESGGIEANISAIADGGILVGDSAGSMAIRAGALTAGAAGFLTHEVGGLEFDASAVGDNDFIVGDSAGSMALESGDTARISLGVGSTDAVSFAAITSVAANDGAATTLTLRNSAASGSIDETVEIAFQHVDANGPGGKIVSVRQNDYSSAGNEDSSMEFFTALNGTDVFAFSIVPTGVSGNHRFHMNDTTNANMTAGLTINQLAADNEILAFKSSDVDHPMTDLAETDTWGVFEKVSGASGGIHMVAYSDGSQATVIQSNASTEVTTDTSASTGALHLRSALNTSATVGVLGATGNMVVMDNNGTARWLIKGNGDVHQTTDAHTALDDENDVMLSRELTLFGEGAVDSEWDPYSDASGANLKRLGIISEDGSMINTTKERKLFHGAHWQSFGRFMSLMELLEEDTPGITARMQVKLDDAQMPQLPI